MLYDFGIIVVVQMAVAAILLLTPLRDQRVFTNPTPTAIVLIVWFLYLSWCWRHGGLTLGMRAWRVRLIAPGSDQPTWGMCLIRFIVSMGSFACFGLGFLWALFDPRRRTWHDLASRTELVREG